MTSDLIFHTITDQLNHEKITLEKGSVISSHHQKVEDFYLLVEGTINYYLSLDHPKKDVLVGKTKTPFTPIGWSGFNMPGRFMCNAKVSSKTAGFLKFNFSEVREFVYQNHHFDLVKGICQKLYQQLEGSILKQLRYSPVQSGDQTDQLESYYISPESCDEEVMKLMRRSPFIEAFDEKYLKELVKIVERRDYVSGELIFRQDDDTGGLYLLIQGSVAIRRIESSQALSLRSISTPGFIFGWSSLIEVNDSCSATTTHDTSVYFIKKELLTDLVHKDKKFGTAFFLRLLWLVGNQLHVSHVRQISLKLNHDQLAIHNLVESNRSKLSLSSRLHQAPHLLNDRNTLGLGYDLLHELNKSGDANERHLASLCLDLLKSGSKEREFLEGLKKIYQVVAEQGKDRPPEEVRKACSQASKEVFSRLNYHIDGWKNLPDQSGNIFIYNHLLNDPYYTLANNFQITLDSHFISSMVLDEKYHDPGLRIVRIGKGAEYGHQNYYENLGYINVYTKDSDQPDQANKDEARNIFYEKAGHYLNEKNNLIISPEGVSYTTEESPGPFKLGAFGLALKQAEEPFIVPVALCYFDRRISSNLLYCRIMEPFKVSEYLDQPDKSSLKRFVKSYQKTFAKEVKRSIKIVSTMNNQ